MRVRGFELLTRVFATEGTIKIAKGGAAIGADDDQRSCELSSRGWLRTVIRKVAGG